MSGRAPQRFCHFAKYNKYKSELIWFDFTSSISPLTSIQKRDHFHSFFLCNALLLGIAISTKVSQDVPLITVLNGTYAGVHSSSYNQDFFLGMPFAYPPGDADRPIACGLPVSEDCLTINVIRPSNYTDQLLPVAVYIYGEGFIMGGSGDPRLNSSYLIQDSISINAPILAVNFNYRLSAFGFLGGSELFKAGALTLWLRNQRLALRWVQGSVGAHLLAYNGRNDGLFRGPISLSGSPDEIYAKLTTSASYENATNTLDCLRNVPLDILGDLVNSTATARAIWRQALDNNFVVDLPIRQLERGDFVKVPYLLGSNTDDGSDFIPGANLDHNTLYPTVQINTDNEFLNYITLLGANSTTVPKLLDLYSQNATDQILATYPNNLGPEVGYQYKRAAYQYRWNVIPNGIPRHIGATHAKEIVSVFNDLKGWDYDVSPWTNRPQSYPDLAYTMSTTWAAFVATGNPNRNGIDGVGTEWPVYSNESSKTFVFGANVTSYVRMTRPAARASTLRNATIDLYSLAADLFSTGRSNPPWILQYAPRRHHADYSAVATPPPIAVDFSPPMPLSSKLSHVEQV
ncbi:hypothetical protein MBM_01345 [Drepanopeziza brunnea f. sp. 'multigermtubi' MB_m1]|uniref:Carboxylesterase type B domain-containing protein n=1 Tax=Marssonina brunnea f. sp. multigermtubi (strain MB_m1) TaxID=1072389 RepID=K1XJ09_MARBU|nr:uncharacterized protein MBM_01345 [Drepanopeziza brunnea f. sp. 'multigermtubi' MB_m1]EKD20663.1 hypothetical protein MBM_01345 [Drepanopeziza brunnea f. sp. 'multigermtubi' MB_m1]